MFEQPRWQRLALIPTVSGLAWMWLSAVSGGLAFLLAIVPGCLLLASGVACLLWPGDIRIPQYTALGGLAGVLLGLPLLFVAGLGTGLAVLLLSTASFVTAGAVSVHQEPHTDEVPDPQPSLGLSWKVAVDDALLGWMGVSIQVPSGGERRRIREEISALRGHFVEHGWLEKPTDYHEAPPALEDPRITRRRAAGLDFEHLSFESGYEPRPGEPGRERWLGYAPNRTAHAWVLRHPGPERPWLLCVHGYQMGSPVVDLLGLRARWLHHRLGLNLALPTLPLHGARKIGRISGDGFLAGDAVASVHAEAQTMWDLRRVLSWVRAQGAPAVGAFGLSLGGYQTSLLATLDGDLACAIPGIPLTDIAGAFWRHGPALQIRYLERIGLARDEVHDVLRVVSPLVLPPRVPHERRYIFGAVADRLVPSVQVRDLWRHWEKPEMLWFQGSHLSLFQEPEVPRFIERGLRESGLVA